METYLPSPFDFLYWQEIEKSFLLKKALTFPKCVELNITGREEFKCNYNNEIDIFTLERVLEELSKINLEWLVLGNKNEIFLHKSIYSFFKLLKKFKLKIYSLKSNALYLNRIEITDLFDTVKKNLFIKKKNQIKSYEEEIFEENIQKLITYKKSKNLIKPDIYILKDDLQEEIEIYQGEIKLIKHFNYCLPELKNYLPFFFLSIDKNGFCYTSENYVKPISSIFFNSIKKIWVSKEIKKIRKWNGNCSNN